MFKGLTVSFSVLLILGVLVSTPAMATPVTGSFSILGGVTVGGPGFPHTFLTTDFLCDDGPCIANPAPMPGTMGSFEIDTPLSGEWATPGYDGSRGQVGDLNPLINSPIGVPIFIADWMIFDFAGSEPGGVAIDLTFVHVGPYGSASCAAPPAIGQVCTPTAPFLVNAGNPTGKTAFGLSNTARNRSLLTVSVNGVARRIATGETTPIQGIFTAQFNEYYQSILADLSAGIPVSATYSATFETIGIPETATIATLLTGLVAMGALLRRRK
jgi:hypothetical protein